MASRLGSVVLFYEGAVAAGTFVLGGIIAWLWLRGTISRLKAELGARDAEKEGLLARCQAAEASVVQAQADLGAARSIAERVPHLEREIDAARTEAAAMAATNAALRSEMDAMRLAHQEKVASLSAVRSDIETTLKALAGDALKANQTSLLELTNQILRQHEQTLAAEDAKKQQQLAALLQPIADLLTRNEADLKKIEEERRTAYGALTAELKSVAEAQQSVRAEASKLVNALRASPQTRGRWGEQQLQNVLELSGMVAHCDFIPQQTFETEKGRPRPDVVIRLPGNRFIVVDSKVSLSAYLDAVEALDDAAREACLKRHAAQVRMHMKQLSGKAYWDGLTVTPDFVAMFIPGDNFLAAAMERDPNLFEDAIKGRVVIVTPTTLVALAKAVAYGWRQEKIAENHRRIAQLGRDLYRRLQIMGEHVAKLGSSLEGTVKRYNHFVGSLEGSVMPGARRFHELEVEGTSQPIAVIEPVETEARQLRRDRDLIVPNGIDEDATASGVHAG